MTARTTAGAVVVAALCTAVLTACSSGDGPVLWPGDLSGDKTTQSFAAEGFTEVSLGGDANLTLTQGDNFSVDVTTDSALFDSITVVVVGAELQINQEYTIIGSQPAMDVAITLPDLTQLHLSGAADARVTGIRADNLKVQLTGSSDAEIEADAAVLTLSVSGAGSVVMRGTVAVASISVSGAADIDGKDVTIGDATIDVSGAGSVSARVRGSLDARVSGAGNVTYYGDPEISEEVSGAGSLRRG